MYTLETVNVHDVKPFLGRERGKKEFEGIISSIKDKGLKYPIALRKIKPKKKRKKELKRSGTKFYRYELVWGHGRLEAAKELGWRKIQALVTEKMTDIDLIKMFLIENEVRSPMTAYERASLMKDDFDSDMTVSQIAAKHNLTENTVPEYLSTLESISKKAQKRLESGNLSMSDARYISSFDKREQDVLIDQNVRGPRLQKLVRDMADQKKKKKQKITQTMMVDRLIELKEDLTKLQKEQKRTNTLYLWSVGNLRKLAQDPAMVKMLKKHKVDLSVFV